MEKKKSISLKKPLKINISPSKTSRSKDSDNEEKSEEKLELKEDYSSFLIRMLEEKPKKIKNFSSTIYKNNILSKKKYFNYNPFNTNYSPNIKKVSFSIDQKQEIKKPIDATNTIKNKNKKNLIKFTDRNGSKIPIKNINQFISTQYTSQNNKIFKSFDFNNTNKDLNNEANKGNKNSNILTKPSILKNLKNNKKVKMIRSVNNINKMRLNALYGYDNNFFKSKKYLLKEKDFTGLENYQNDILKVSQRNLSKAHMFKLFTELQSIKKNADLVKPLPPINYPALIYHSFKEAEDRRKISKISLEDKKFKDMDEYEKELYKIKKTNAFKRVKLERNKRLYKIYEILPEHVIEALYKNKIKI